MEYLRNGGYISRRNKNFLCHCKATSFISLGKPICCGLEIVLSSTDRGYHEARKGKAWRSVSKALEVGLMLG